MAISCYTLLMWMCFSSNSNCTDSSAEQMPRAQHSNPMSKVMQGQRNAPLARARCSCLPHAPAPGREAGASPVQGGGAQAPLPSASRAGLDPRPLALRQWCCLLFPSPGAGGKLLSSVLQTC